MTWRQIDRLLAWLIVALAVYGVVMGMRQHVEWAYAWAAGAGWYRWLKADTELRGVVR